jgi:RNA polymerase sigma-70 factor (ECF subfamily)
MITRAIDDQSELLASLRGGDEAAFTEFVHCYSGRMLAVARRLLRNDDDAADAVQDGFVSAFKALSSFEGNSSLGTWLHRIVVNVCLMKMRTQSRRRDCSLEDLLPRFDKSGHHLEPVCRWSGPSSEGMQRHETQSQVRACIEKLPDDHRVVLMLRDIEELDTEQTAELLHVTTGTVKTRLHRARQALCKLLEPMFTR